jgi:choline dehydrogenase-like flavoprotein
MPAKPRPTAGAPVSMVIKNNTEGHRRLQTKLKEMLKGMDMHDHMLPRSLYIGKNIPIGGTAHQAGTIRFGRDPRSSALDPNCKIHDLDNLYVVDPASSS